jgi:hypothetical protein
MGAVLGRPGGDRPNRDVGARNIAERIALLTTCESSLLVFFVHVFHRTLLTAMTC